MKASTRNQIKGTAKEAKGRIKQIIGHATRNQRLARQGQAEAMGGRARPKAWRNRRGIRGNGMAGSLGFGCFGRLSRFATRR